jgi:type IV secretion system protein VirB3
LWAGGDRELVMFAGLLAFALVFSAQTMSAAITGVLLWVGSLFALRRMGKADPKMRWVYLRHRQYQAYYPARATPFRTNTRSQARRYR